ncbi:Uncharacterised protein [Staphylococcus gallinarum]|uniref:Uncharacterized protein n=1 Tax=Staphylococcus gallinarum TaxID=1293 RepID=A0A380FIE4_STAGA|nr:Uncharacterised protein [Staphylococcus gallinarum]
MFKIDLLANKKSIGKVYIVPTHSGYDFNFILL